MTNAQNEPAVLGPVERPVSRLVISRADGCTQGCNGCDNCTDYGNEPCDHTTHKEGLQCKACCGKGWNDEVHAVDGHYSGYETFRMACQSCDGAGEVKS